MTTNDDDIVVVLAFNMVALETFARGTVLAKITPMSTGHDAPRHKLEVLDGFAGESGNIRPVHLKCCFSFWAFDILLALGGKMVDESWQGNRVKQCW